ncbi:helix-turn-helix domain-containing protein [Fimbriimonas ginsengisoli]|nr:helix-turn-helix transcriptional regulator [Fimbriimonas ginsengisoli]
MAVVSAKPGRLTREDQILALAAEGLTDRQMAARLGISAETIASYWRRIFARFDAMSRTEVVARALQKEAQGLTEERERLLFEIAERQRVERLLQQSNQRLFVLMDSLPSAVLFETEDRKVKFCNESFCRIFSHKALPKTLVGRDAIRMTKDAALGFTDTIGFLRRIDEIIASGEAVAGERIQRTNGSWLERDYVPIQANEEVVGHLWHYREIPR